MNKEEDTYSQSLKIQIQHNLHKNKQNKRNQSHVNIARAYHFGCLRKSEMVTEKEMYQNKWSLIRINGWPVNHRQFWLKINVAGVKTKNASAYAVPSDRFTFSGTHKLVCLYYVNVGIFGNSFYDLSVFKHCIYNCVCSVTFVCLLWKWINASFRISYFLKQPVKIFSFFVSLLLHYYTPHCVYFA